MFQRFIQIPESLLEHPSVVNAPVAQRWVLICIIQDVCFLPCKHDDHGQTIDLEIGQMATTIRRFAQEKNIDKNDVERAFKRFFKVGILRQEVRHIKTIITITHKETYERIKRYSETLSETKVRQERDKSETQKEILETFEIDEINKKKIKKEKVEKIFHEHGEYVKLTTDQYDSLVSEFGKDYIESLIEDMNLWIPNNRNYKDYNAAIRGWIRRSKKNTKEEIKESTFVTGVYVPDWMKTQTM